jgi:hypothetical protein
VATIRGLRRRFDEVSLGGRGPVPHPVPEFLLRLAPAAAFVVPPWSQHFVARRGCNSFLG